MKSCAGSGILGEGIQTEIIIVISDLDLEQMISGSLMSPKSLAICKLIISFWLISYIKQFPFPSLLHQSSEWIYNIYRVDESIFIVLVFKALQVQIPSVWFFPLFPWSKLSVSFSHSGYSVLMWTHPGLFSICAPLFPVPCVFFFFSWVSIQRCSQASHFLFHLSMNLIPSWALNVSSLLYLPLSIAPTP